MLIEHMKQGLSFDAFGAVVNVTRKTLYNWTRAFPDFQESKEIGESHSRMVWEKMGMVLIARGGGNGSAATYIFNMKNRFGYRDIPKEIDEDEPQDQKPKLHKKATPADLAHLLKIARGEKKK